MEGRVMEGRVMGVCIILGFLGAVAAALSFAAEAKRIKASQVDIDYSGCVFPRSTAIGLGLGAAIALFISQLIISFQTGCCTSKFAKLPINWASARPYSFISRIAFGIGIVLLIAAVSISSKDGGEKTYVGYYTVYTVCYVVKPGVFASAGVLSLVSVGFGIFFYLAVAAGIAAAPNTNIVDPTAVHVEQPQIYPPQQPQNYPPQKPF